MSKAPDWLLRAFNFGEVCDTSGKARAGKARLDALTVCLVKVHGRLVDLGQCSNFEIVLEGIKCIRNDTRLNGMHDINDGTHEDAMWILPHLNTIEGIVHLVHWLLLKFFF